MEFLQYYNQTKFLGFVPRIRQNPKGWQLVEVVLTGKTRHNAAYIAKQVKEYFGARDGIIFICNSREILALVNMGSPSDIVELASGLNNKLPKYSCTAAASDITEEGLLKFQFHLRDIEEAKKEASPGSSLLALRKERAEKVVMVVDDDMFMRSLIVKALKSKARVIELDKPEAVVDTYLEELPDALFLDIHMPGLSGIDILSELLNFDDTAYVVIMSSDSVKDNVLEAKRLGAKGFVAKPFTAEKIELCYNKSPSVVLQAESRKTAKETDG